MRIAGLTRQQPQGDVSEAQSSVALGRTRLCPPLSLQSHTGSCCQHSCATSSSPPAPAPAGCSGADSPALPNFRESEWECKAFLIEEKGEKQHRCKINLTSPSPGSSSWADAELVPAILLLLPMASRQIWVTELWRQPLAELVLL